MLQACRRRQVVSTIYLYTCCKQSQQRYILAYTTNIWWHFHFENFPVLIHLDLGRVGI